MVLLINGNHSNMKWPHLKTIILLALSLILFSCSSSDDSSGAGESEYYIDFTINGINKHYSFVVGAEEQYVEISDMYILTISGVANTTINNPTEVESIEIILFSSLPIAEDEYSSSYYDGTNQFGAKVGYLTSSSTETNVYSTRVNNLSTMAWASVHVIERTDTYIIGTFNANLFNVNDENDSPLITHFIENGEFKVPLNN